MADELLIRYGVMREVSRFTSAIGRPPVGSAVVVRTSRGEELGEVVGHISSTRESGETAATVLRTATETDLETYAGQRAVCEAEFSVWHERIRQWQIDVELVDLERTLGDEKLILYVLNGRGPDTTKLALHAAAAGLGVIEVQPVGREGLISAPPSGGCGGCGCK